MFLGLIKMVVVQMEIAESMDKISDFKITGCGNDMGEQSIRGDIEGHAEKNISTTLVKLAA